jgi:hypothetical protein
MKRVPIKRICAPEKSCPNTEKMNRDSANWRERNKTRRRERKNGRNYLQ